MRVARSLDVIGERWALLIVRELLLGPKPVVLHLGRWGPVPRSPRAPGGASLLLLALTSDDQEAPHRTPVSPSIAAQRQQRPQKTVTGPSR